MSVKKEASGPPFRPGRSRGSRHAGRSLAGHRDWAGDFVLVCAG